MRSASKLTDREFTALVKAGATGIDHKHQRMLDQVYNEDFLEVSRACDVRPVSPRVGSGDGVVVYRWERTW